VESCTRILGIDYGSERIGLALSDPLGVLARPHETLRNDPTLWHRLKSIVAAEHVLQIVVGMPLNLKGKKGKKAEEVEVFIERLKAETRADVTTWDERFTSTMAHQTLIAMGTTRKSRQNDKGRVDAMAAAILLQSYLDRRKRPASGEPWET